MMTDANPHASRLRDLPALERARHLWRSGQRGAALDAFEKAVQLEPRNARALIEYAQASAHAFENARAEQLLVRAEELAGQDATAATRIAESYRTIHRPEKAMDIYERLRNEQQLPLPSLAQLATLYEQSNRLPEALDAISTCVQRAPGQLQPQIILARVQRQLGEFSAAAALLAKIVSAQDVSVTVLVHAWSELALVRDQLSDYAGAVEAIEHGKSLLRQMPEAEQKSRQSLAISQAFASLYADLNESLISAWSDCDPGDHECTGIAHLLGFPRSGTTLLEQVLDSHPQLHSASERPIFAKEIFPAMCRAGDRQDLTLAAIRDCTHEKLTQLRQRYLAYHEAVRGKALAGCVHLDKNPNHTSLIVGLYRLFPESRFIFALRDPRDVIVSNYMRYFMLTEFSAAYLTWGSTCALYAHEMNVWLRMRELLAGNWIEVKYEQTVADVEQAARQVLQFLNLPWDERVLEYRDLSTRKTVRSPTYAEVRKPVYSTSIGRWKNYEQWLEPYMDRLEPYVQMFGYD